MYDFHQKSGKTPSRTEERWGDFARISEVLAQWIQRVELTMPPPRMPGNLSRFHRRLRVFAEKYPGRVPASLLKYVLLIMLNRCAEANLMLAHYTTIIGLR